MPPKADTLPAVSVIVPFYGDGIDALDACVAAIMAQDYPGEKFELILADNNPVPAVKDRYAGLARPPRVVHEPEPGSFRARNTGIKHARGAALAFTDADCLPDPAWLRNGARALQEDKDCGLVAGGIVMTYHNPDKRTLCERYDVCFHLHQEFFLWNYHFGVTANLFTWKSVIEAAGAFDATLLSQGDVEWGQRLWRLGYRQYYAGEAVAYHPARASFRTLAVKARRVFGADFSRDRANGFAPILRHQLNYHKDLWRRSAERRRKLRLIHRAGVHAVFGMLIAVRCLEFFRLLGGGRPERR